MLPNSSVRTYGEILTTAASSCSTRCKNWKKFWKITLEKLARDEEWPRLRPGRLLMVGEKIETWRCGCQRRCRLLNILICMDVNMPVAQFWLHGVAQHWLQVVVITPHRFPVIRSRNYGIITLKLLLKYFLKLSNAIATHCSAGLYLIWYALMLFPWKRCWLWLIFKQAVKKQSCDCDWDPVKFRFSAVLN